MRRALLLVAAGLLAGCVGQRPKLAPMPLDIGTPVPETPPPNGSLWRPMRADNYPVLDVRAHFPGELLTVLVNEDAQGAKDASTQGDQTSSISAAVSAFFGVPAAAVGFLPSGFTPENIIDSSSSRNYKNDGKTTRTGSLTASITVRVSSVDGAGNLHVQGDKVVTVNNEDQHLVLTGIVRPVDIASDNSVASSRLADARIAYYGYGPVGDKQNAPMVHRLMDWIWPF
jgi:flagellar L-ring protein FlgH